METHKIPLNEIFDDGVTKITATMLPKNFRSDVHSTRAVQDEIAKLIDQLGQDSAESQGLNKVITSAEKLRNNPRQSIYLLKNPDSNYGQGGIIGMLKVGRKHLFLFDSKEIVHEVEPLCILDFYIMRDYQRMGYGRVLFDYMLHELELTPDQVAIDGPSDKMENFLSKNFGIEKLIRQNNNFAVAPGFFDRSDAEISNSGGDVAEAPAAAVGRFAAPRPTSAIANVIHGAGAVTSRPQSPEYGGDEASAAPVVSYRDFNPPEMWDDDWEDPSEPEYDQEAYEFDPDQPAAERRDDRRALGAIRVSSPVRYSPARRSSPPTLERPASLAVQHGAQPASLALQHGAQPASLALQHGAQPASLAVQHGAQPVPSAPPAEPTEVPAAGMPSGAATAAAAAAQSAAGTPAGAGGRRDSQLTDRGHFDVKYYHNKLW